MTPSRAAERQRWVASGSPISRFERPLSHPLRTPPGRRTGPRRNNAGSRPGSSIPSRPRAFPAPLSALRRNPIERILLRGYIASIDNAARKLPEGERP